MKHSLVTRKDSNLYPPMPRYSTIGATSHTILISYNQRGGRSGSEGVIFTKYIIQYTNDIGINILINKFVLTSFQV